MLSRSVFQAAYLPEQFVTINCQRSGMFLAKFDQELVGKKTEWFKVSRLAINRWFVDARVAISAWEIETKFISLTSKVKNICASTPTQLTQIVLSIIVVLVDTTLGAHSPSQALPNKYFIHLSQDFCARSTHSEQKTAQTETQTANAGNKWGRHLAGDVCFKQLDLKGQRVQRSTKMQQNATKTNLCHFHQCAQQLSDCKSRWHKDLQS